MIRRICSDEKKFMKRPENLVGWLVHRDYNDEFLSEQLARESSLDITEFFNQEG